MTIFYVLSTAVYWAVWTLLIVSMADLVCGLVHWAEDSYAEDDWPIIGASVIAPNRLHHSNPRAFVANNWWQSAHLQIKAGIAIVLLSLWGNWFSCGLVLFVAVAVNGNEVHKWAHRSKAENGLLITWLQDNGLVQSRRHHASHHRGLRYSHYCSVTNWVNPVLDKTGFWRFLEFCIAKCTGVTPQIEAFSNPRDR